MTHSRIRYDRQWGQVFYGIGLSASVFGASFKILVSQKDQIDHDVLVPCVAGGTLISLVVIDRLVKRVLKMLDLQRDRAAAVRSLSTALGVTYREALTEREIDRYASLALFRAGAKESGVTRKLTNILQGSVSGVDILVADFEIEMASSRGRNRALSGLRSAESHDRYMALMPGQPTVCVFSAMGAAPPLPDFFLDPETRANKPLWDGLGKLTGWRDLDFSGTETRERFSHRYRLRGNTDEVLRAFFHDERIAFFAEHTGWSVQASPQHVVIWRGRSLVRTSSLADLCDEATAIFKSLWK
ncbi:MAG: hypothetical protein ABGZ17_31945 [Planctomycetaceae bacterium]